MKCLKVIAVFLMIGMIGLVFIPARGGSIQQTAEELYEAAVLKKEAAGNLEEAVRLFREVIATFPDNRTVAGKAQLQIGLCYEKLGGEAIKAYELVLKNYPDQPELVARARERLEALRREAPVDVPVEKLPIVMDPFVSAFSRDGTKIAGIVWEVPGQNISVYDYKTGKMTQVTHFDWKSPGHGWTHNPVFSPDGQKVAYQFGYFDASGVELRASTLEGKEWTIYRISKGTILPCDWLSDGNIVLMLVKSEDKPWEMGLIPASGGEFKVLRTFEDFQGVGEALPAFSPDGRFIVFDEGPIGKQDIKAMTRDGKSVCLLTDHPAQDCAACWSPDGKDIAFISDRTGGRAIWGLKVEEGKPAGNPFMIRAGMEDTHLVDWTERGLACVTAVWPLDIFTMPVDPKTGEPLDEARMLDYTPTGKNSCPCWSPDGKHLAFFVSESPGRGCIVVISPDEGDVTEYEVPMKLGRYQRFLSNLSWLPDGSGIGFSMPSLGESKVSTLFRLNFETEKWETWSIPSRTGGTWGPDASTFVFEKRGEASRFEGIAEWNPDSGQERLIYLSPEELKKGKSVTHMKFSNDSKKLLFSLDNNQLFVVDMEGGDSGIVASDSRCASWSPDAGLILALDTREDSMPKTMSVFPFGGGQKKELDLGGNLPKDYHLIWADWSPDGRRIAFSTRSLYFEVFLLKNIIPEK